MKVVIAGGSGSLGQRLAADFEQRGFDVAVLTRTTRDNVPFRQIQWDGNTAGPWTAELNGAIVVNLAGELVDRRPTRDNIELLRRSRVEATRALVKASKRCDVPPPIWLQMSTLAIYGDAGEEIIDEQNAPADGPPQMAGVVTAWEDALDGANAERVVRLRTGIVLDNDTPAFTRLTKLTRFGLGGRIASGNQWISWIHIDDFLRAVRFLVDESTLDGVLHLTSPNPARNRDMMAALRAALHRPWSPPTPRPLVHIGALFMRTDPALALTGRRCVPNRLLDAGFEFEHPTFPGAVADLVESQQVRKMTGHDGGAEVAVDSPKRRALRDILRPSLLAAGLLVGLAAVAIFVRIDRGGSVLVALVVGTAWVGPALASTRPSFRRLTIIWVLVVALLGFWFLPHTIVPLSFALLALWTPMPPPRSANQILRTAAAVGAVVTVAYVAVVVPSAPPDLHVCLNGAGGSQDTNAVFDATNNVRYVAEVTLKSDSEVVVSWYAWASNRDIEEFSDRALMVPSVDGVGSRHCPPR